MDMAQEAHQAHTRARHPRGDSAFAPGYRIINTREEPHLAERRRR